MEYSLQMFTVDDLDGGRSNAMRLHSDITTTGDRYEFQMYHGLYPPGCLRLPQKSRCVSLALVHRVKTRGAQKRVLLGLSGVNGPC